MTLEEYKKSIGQSVSKNNKYVKNIIVRIFISIILALTILIISNISTTAEKFIKKNLFETDFKFSTINKLYNHYFLNIKKEDDTKLVNSDKTLVYNKIEKYYDGAKLSIDKNYAVKLLKSGIVVYIGEKDHFGNTIIVQQSNGVDAWYGNINDVNIKLYDYIEKDSVIGNAEEVLYLAFQKDGAFQDYNEFIK